MIIIKLIVGENLKRFEKQADLYYPWVYESPKNQSILTYNLVSKCYSQEVTKTIVTNSETIFNAIRKAVIDDLISEDKIIIEFYPKADDLIPEKIVLDHYGIPNKWPKGLFDQLMEDSIYILKNSNKKRRIERLSKLEEGK